MPPIGDDRLCGHCSVDLLNEAREATPPPDPTVAVASLKALLAVPDNRFFLGSSVTAVLKRYDAMETLLKEIAATDLGDGDYFADRIRTLLETP